MYAYVFVIAYHSRQMSRCEYMYVSMCVNMYACNCVRIYECVHISKVES